MPFNTLYQLYAHMKDRPEDLKNAQFLHMPDALAFALGGNFETEYTIASTGNLVDAKTQDWDFELIDKLGLPRDIFPKIVQPCSFSGVLSEELQKELDAPAIPIVKVGGHDTASAVVAVPAQPGEKFAYHDWLVFQQFVGNIGVFTYLAKEKTAYFDAAACRLLSCSGEEMNEFDFFNLLESISKNPVEGQKHIYRFTEKNVTGAGAGRTAPGKASSSADG